MKLPCFNRSNTNSAEYYLIEIVLLLGLFKNWRWATKSNYIQSFITIKLIIFNYLL